MRTLFLFLSMALVGSAAEANLCAPSWLRTASGSAARALIRAGADVNEICNTSRNRPLHQALLNDRVDPEVIRALLDGGADTAAENIHRENPVEYAMDRWARAEATFDPGTAAYRRERRLYELMFDRFGAAGDAQSEAQSLLCDVEWWRSSATGSSVRALLAGGADPEAACNANNDRPLHLALRPENFVTLPAGVKDGVLTLAASGVSLGARNNSGRTVLALAEIRYDRYLGRAMRTRPAWCAGGAVDPDVEAYLGVKYLATGESRESLLDAARRDLCGGAGGDVPRQAGSVFRECDVCPEMVVMPGGRLALGRYEVTVGEYAASGGGAGGGCRVYGSPGLESQPSASWRNPGFSQTDRHPVVCVSWYDAQEYVAWLSRTTGATYRLPSEGEWGGAAGGSGGGSDGAWSTASVGSYGSNGVGLSDMVGNVWEWTEDCWEGDCGRRVVRGGSWLSAAGSLRPGARSWDRAGNRLYDGGFRVARTLD